MPLRAESLSKERFLQAEAPRYDEVTGELLWVDMRAGRFYVGRIVAGKLVVELSVYVGLIGCATPITDRSLGWVLAGGGELTWVRRDGSTELILGGLTTNPAHTLNDGVAAPDGSFWVGSQTAARIPEGALYRIAPELTWEVVRDAVTVSNGIDFTPEGDSCYYIDTLPHRNLERLRVTSGQISQTSTVTTISGGNPDGLVVDAEGAIWVAVWGAGQARRYSSAGTLLQTVSVPAERASAVALVERTLVITTAQLDGEDTGGRIFAATVEVPGKELATFAVTEATLEEAARSAGRV